VLAQQLQSADVLASHRVFMVLFRTLKELSTKRLAVDQRNYAEVFDFAKTTYPSISSYHYSDVFDFMFFPLLVWYSVS
jgi:nitrate reductase assembly molybdenum cofactor insertion protein NarJ